MDAQITINLSGTDKKFIEGESEKVRLPASTFCRYIILKNLNAGKLPEDILREKKFSTAEVFDAITNRGVKSN